MTRPLTLIRHPVGAPHEGRGNIWFRVNRGSITVGNKKSPFDRFRATQLHRGGKVLLRALPGQFTRVQSALKTASKLAPASPNSMRVFSLKNNGFCTPA